MFKKFVTIMLVLSILCSMVSLGITANAYYEADIVYGDVDGNGIVNTDDARRALQIASGVVVIEDDIQLKRADMNFDGVITIFDARQILRGIAGLASLQPTGAITGFDGGGVFGNEETLVAYFNAYLNKIKVTESDGKQYIAADITKTETDTLTDFNINEVELPGLGFGMSAESIADLVQENITEADETGEETDILQGSEDFSLVSVEGKNYVSALSTSDVFGSRASYDEEYELLTIEIALPDTEVEMVEQSAYSKILDASKVLEKQDTTLMSILKAGTQDSVRLRQLKNCVLKTVVDIKTGNVLSYTISYQSMVYIAQIDFTVSSFNMLLKGIVFEKEHLVKYENFNWDAEGDTI